MTAKTPRFERAQDFLAQRVVVAPAAKRIGMQVHARIDRMPSSAQANTTGLRALIRSVAASTRQAFRAHLAEFSDNAQRISVELFYAQSNGLKPYEQVALLLEAKDSPSVADVAARQRIVPIELQRALIANSFHHVDAMQALAANLSTHPETLLPLAAHPSWGVRTAVAANIGPRMKVEERALAEEKELVFNTLIERYEDSFAPFIIPACKDPEQLQRIFERSSLTPLNAHLFTDNPYASNDILLSVVSSNTIGLLPGGQKVKERARSLVDNRLGDHGPTIN